MERETNTIDIGKVITYWVHRREAESEKPFNATEIANKIGMKPTYFSRLRYGKVPSPTSKMIARLARGFGVSINEFLSEPTEHPEHHVSFSTPEPLQPNRAVSVTSAKGIEDMHNQYNNDYRDAIVDLLDNMNQCELARTLGYIEGIVGKREKKIK